MSLKYKIIILVGGIIILLMMIISISFLYQYRATIIEKEVDNVRSLTDAVSIPIIDAFIYGEQDDIIPHELLERYISYLSDRIDGIQYAYIYDGARELVTYSNFKTAPGDQPGIIPLLDQVPAGSEIVSIYNHDLNGWVIEVVSPIQIAGMNWGFLRLGFDGSDMRREIGSIFFALLALSLGVTGSALLVLYLSIGRLTRSLGMLTKAIDTFDLMSTDTEVSLPDSNDEIGYLSKRFELLQKRLIESKYDLAESQRNIYRAEKLAFIGRLSSGVAHEINNSVNGIQSCLYAISNDPKNHEQTEEYMQLISEGLQHIETIVKKLLEYSRKNSPSMASVNISEVVDNVLKLCSYKLQSQGISITFEPDPGLPEIKADKHLIREVIMNLLINSMDAVPEGGCICIKAAKMNRKNIYLSVEDNGSGVAPEHTEVIFEPFFTTKDTGQGTGLGLSVVQGIVESHDGTITLDSKPGIRTVFTITLPINGKHERTTD